MMLQMKCNSQKENVQEALESHQKGETLEYKFAVLQDETKGGRGKVRQAGRMRIGAGSCSGFK